MIVKALGISLRKLIFCLHGEMEKEMPIQDNMQEAHYVNVHIYKWERKSCFPSPPPPSAVTSLKQFCRTPYEKVNVTYNKKGKSRQVKALSIMGHTIIFEKENQHVTLSFKELFTFLKNVNYISNSTLLCRKIY